MSASPQASASSSANRASSLSFTLTIPSGVTQGVVLIGISVDDTNGRTVSSVTVGGSAATAIRHDGVSGSKTWIYQFISGNSTGAKTIAITLSGSVSGDLIAGATVFDGADQTTPVSNDLGSNGTSTIPTLNVTSSTNDSVFDCVHANGQSTIGVGSGQTQQWNVQGPRNRTRGGGSTEPGASSVAMSWTVSGSTLTSHSAVNVRGAAASGSISGSSSGVASESATLTGTGALSGIAPGVAASSALLTGKAALSGTASGSSTCMATGTSVSAIAGQASGVASASASIEATGSLSGNSSGVSAGSSTLSGKAALSGNASGVASSTALISAAGKLFGSSSGLTSSTAQLVGKAALSGHASGIASSTATLSSLGSGPSASAHGSSIVTGTLTGKAALSGAINASSSTSGLLIGSGRLAGTIIAASSSTALISAIASISGVAAGSASLTGNLQDHQVPDTTGLWFNEADIDLILSDSPDTFTWTGITHPCILTENDVEETQGRTGPRRMLKISHVLIKASAFPGIKTGDQVQVNGGNFSAARVDLVQDGAMLEVMLRSVN